MPDTPKNNQDNAAEGSNATKPAKAPSAGPKGTRDFYPDDLLRRRYITESWRAVSIRHGFEEIDGPTFEQAELYAVKSGEGILGELFQAYSGKAPEEREQVMRDGIAPYALRPEFTPTLARMYAARAKQLPGVTRWFCVQPFFRAERPQRGRLREFYQWNCDVVGESSPAADVVCMQTVVNQLAQVGILYDVVKIHFNFRQAVEHMLRFNHGVTDNNIDKAFVLIDQLAKRTNEQLIAEASLFSDSPSEWLDALRNGLNSQASSYKESKEITENESEPKWRLSEFVDTIEKHELQEWMLRNSSIVRGLAYYTGTVFEVIAEGERAVAGGGRYDNLIELFGGPPTPAVGFGMGDVVLTNLLDDRNLMPEGAELRGAIDRIVRTASLRPEAFVVANGGDDTEPLVTPLLAQLRRGIERAGFADELQAGTAKPWHADRYDVRPLHARTTDKSTRNPKKLLADANRQHARLFVEVHGEHKVELRDLDRQEAVTPDAVGIDDHASFSVHPSDPNYIGRAISRVFDPTRGV